MVLQKAVVGPNPGGGDGSNQHRRGTGFFENPVALVRRREPKPKPATLAEAGIDQNLAHRARRRQHRGDQRRPQPCGRGVDLYLPRFGEVLVPRNDDARRLRDIDGILGYPNLDSLEDQGFH